MSVVSARWLLWVRLCSSEFQHWRVRQSWTLFTQFTAMILLLPIPLPTHTLTFQIPQPGCWLSPLQPRPRKGVCVRPHWRHLQPCEQLLASTQTKSCIMIKYILYVFLFFLPLSLNPSVPSLLSPLSPLSPSSSLFSPSLPPSLNSLGASLPLTPHHQ